jgi:Phospholipase B
MGLALAQTEGLWRGYNDRAPLRRKLSLADLLLLNMVGDLDDVIPALDMKQRRENGEAMPDFDLDPRFARRDSPVQEVQPQQSLLGHCQGH